MRGARMYVGDRPRVVRFEMVDPWLSVAFPEPR